MFGSRPEVGAQTRYQGAPHQAPLWRLSKKLDDEFFGHFAVPFSRTYDTAHDFAGAIDEITCRGARDTIHLGNLVVHIEDDGVKHLLLLKELLHRMRLYTIHRYAQYNQAFVLKRGMQFF